jgi:hypothetical protein
MLGHLGQRGENWVTYWCGGKEQADMGSCYSGLDIVYKIVVTYLVQSEQRCRTRHVTSPTCGNEVSRSLVKSVGMVSSRIIVSYT